MVNFSDLSDKFCVVIISVLCLSVVLQLLYINVLKCKNLLFNLQVN